MWPVINHSAVTFPTPPPVPIPTLFNPQLKNKFFISGTSPKRELVSEVKDSGPAKNFLIPICSRTGNLFIDFSKYGSKCSKFSGNSPNEKSSGTLFVLSNAGIDFPSKIPIKSFPASSLKYTLLSKSLITGSVLERFSIGSVIT